MATIKRLILPNTTPVPRYSLQSNSLRQSCYLCGSGFHLSKVEREREHVIPRALIQPDSFEDNLLLTACSAHNREKGHDEEFVVPYLQATLGDKDSQKIYRFERVVNAAQDHVNKAIVNNTPMTNPLVSILQTMKQNMKEVATYSEDGAYLGQGGAISISVVGDRFKAFYERIAKGYYVAALGSILNWDEFNIKVLFDTNPKHKFLPESVWMFPFKNMTHCDFWDDELVVCGCVSKSPKIGADFAAWAIQIGDNHSAVVTFVDKSYPLPPSKR